MADLDVSDILQDPDFLDQVTLIHRTTTVDSFGQNQLKCTPVATLGTVYPASGKAIQRLPEALRVGDVRSFIIQGEIISDGSTDYPDQIVFKGSKFNVQVVMDWMNWGEGFCEGLCIREKPSA